MYIALAFSLNETRAAAIKYEQVEPETMDAFRKTVNIEWCFKRDSLVLIEFVDVTLGEQI